MKNGSSGQGRTLPTRARSIESLMTRGAHWACHGEEWGTQGPWGGVVNLVANAQLCVVLVNKFKTVLKTSFKLNSNEL